MNKKQRVIGVSGSLRENSLNSRFLRAMQLTTPKNISFDIYGQLGSVPLFNPDAQDHHLPALLHWQNALAEADLVLFASPEYAHGVSGVMKNALDWIVGSGELTDKLVAFPNISVRAALAQSQLAETLQLMGAKLLDDCSPNASLTAPYVLPQFDEHALAEHPEIGPRLRQLWVNLSEALKAASAQNS